MDLSQQEGGKRFAGLAVEIVARGIVAGGLQTIESELSTFVGRRPTSVRELMPAVFEADLNGVLSLDP